MLDRTAKLYTSKDIAAKLGVTIETFYDTRGRLHAEDGLPAPLTRHRPYKWDRASIDAWFARHHPLAPKLATPANDPVPTTTADVDRWREALADHYGAR